MPISEGMNALLPVHSMLIELPEIAASKPEAAPAYVVFDAADETVAAISITAVF